MYAIVTGWDAAPAIALLTMSIVLIVALGKEERNR